MMKDFDYYMLKKGMPLIKDFNSKAEFKHAQEEYWRDRKNLEREFQQDLYEEFGLQDHPKRDDAFALAWDYGHASGYSEVYGYFCDLANLMTTK